MEIAISTGLLFILTTLSAVSLSAAKSYQQRLEGQAKLENSAYITLKKITSDLSESRFFLTLLEPGTDSMIFLSPRDQEQVLQDNHEGDFLFSTAVRYYHDAAENRLIRQATLGN